MDLTPYIGNIITVIIAVGSVYAATVARLTRLETLIESLRAEVEKHNQIVERTYKLESDVDNLYHRLEDLKEILP
jgi:uncharacterized protein Yka (UPF0111/DUF47 family)